MSCFRDAVFFNYATVNEEVQEGGHILLMVVPSQLAMNCMQNTLGEKVH